MKSSKTNKKIKINIFYPNLNKIGTDSWYVELIQARLAENGIEANMINDLSLQDKTLVTMIEYFPQHVKEIPNDKRYIIDVLAAPSSKRMFVELKAMAKSPRKLVSNLIFAIKNPKYASTVTKRGGTINFKELEERDVLLFRDADAAKSAGITKYKTVPIMNPIPVKLNGKPDSNEIHIGTVGFASKNKNNDQIAELAVRLGVKATIIATVSGETGTANDATHKIAMELDKYKSDKIEIITKPLSDREIEGYLSHCTHFIFAQDDTMKPSSAVREMAKYGKPVIATPSTQAREARVPYIVKSLKQIDLNYLKNATELTYPPDGAKIMADVIKDIVNNETGFTD